MKLTGLDPDRLVPPAGVAGLTGRASLNKTLPSPYPGPSTGGPAFQAQEGDFMPREHALLETPQTRTETLAQLVRSLNLSPDSLSAALVTFARHFSLPLDPVLLTKLRREVLSLKTPRESAALAAAAAAGKGVTLTPEALEKYAAAIDPDARGDQKDGQGREGTGGNGFEQKDRQPESPGDISGQVTPESLKRIRDDIDEKDPLLSLLNRLPGKDGERWMVYPFQVSAGGKRFMVSVRAAPGIGKDDARLAVDIAGEDRRWLFAVNRPASPQQRDTAETEVSVSPLPELPLREVLEREIQEVLGPLGGRVTLRESGPFLAECRNKDLPSINEEV
ncbi:MAG: hypothetical protein LBP81_00970 [Treponema sp.]|nr:hypothetical protein [Treponema sp.]